MVAGLLLLLLVGAVAGLLAGLLGVGGGIVIVPALLIYFEQHGVVPADRIMHFALGTSLATIAWTSLSSMYAHHRRAAILWPEVLRLAPGVLVGTWLGTQVADRLSSNTLTLGLSVFLLAVSLQMGLNVQPAPGRRTFSRWVWALLGGGIGLISAWVGIGGGTLTVPLLIGCNIPVRNAIASSAALGFFIALAGTIGYMSAGDLEGRGYAAGAVYWPAVLGIVPTSLLLAPFGAQLAHHIPIQTLKRLFCIFLAAMGIRLMIRVLGG